MYIFMESSFTKPTNVIFAERAISIANVVGAPTAITISKFAIAAL